ncbi:MAG: hypothetical protein HKN88_10045 [Gammaproteobacteria bacterium]|nr:hypothetical protein [Gammaproteobacteria bacterium]NNC98397.1 hypothetical protein [Gammaproteobacteria bacterium]NNM13065.1 hypothetical protein [Gammaproteobacteria bacterium]
MASAGKKPDGNTEERLMQLFQSRAELKQEFNQLQKDKLLLTRTTDAQAHRIEELETDLVMLEKLLKKPEKYANLRVYYQLRKVWDTCNRYIHKFRDRLVDQQRDRERKQQLMEFNQQKTDKLNKINKSIDNRKKLLDGVNARVDELSKKMESYKYPWQFLGKQGVSKQRAIAMKTQSEAYSEIQAMYDQRIKIESQPWPEFDGLDLAGKRSINLAMIALAQYFYMSLTELGLGNKTYQAQRKKPWEITFGSAAEQNEIVHRCAQKLELFAQLKDLGAEVQTRMAKLKENIEYKRPDDSIPDPESITKLVNDVSGTSLTTTITDVNLEVNVLNENYWGLNDLMIP